MRSVKGKLVCSAISAVIVLFLIWGLMWMIEAVRDYSGRALEPNETSEITEEAQVNCFVIVISDNWRPVKVFEMINVRVDKGVWFVDENRSLIRINGRVVSIVTPMSKEEVLSAYFSKDRPR